MATMRLIALILTGLFAANGHGRDCMSTVDELLQIEKEINDTSIHRTYHLCPHTTFSTPVSDTDEKFPFFLRPNMSILCGENGKVENQCIITGGIGLFATPENFDDGNDLGSSVLKGLTFSGLKSSALYISNFYGALNITNCIFKENTGTPNIYIQGHHSTHYEKNKKNLNIFTKLGKDANKLRKRTEHGLMAALNTLLHVDENHASTRKSDELMIEFEGCLFTKNSIETSAGTAVGKSHKLVHLASRNLKTTFSACSFIDNDFATPEKNEEVKVIDFIFNNGGDLKMRSNCFNDCNTIDTFDPILPKVEESFRILSTDVANSTNSTSAPVLAPVTIDDQVMPPVISNLTATTAPVIPASGGADSTSNVTMSPVMAPVMMIVTTAPVIVVNTSAPVMMPEPTEPPQTCGAFLAACFANSECCSKRCRQLIGQAGTCQTSPKEGKAGGKLATGRGGGAGQSGIPGLNQKVP